MQELVEGNPFPLGISKGSAEEALKAITRIIEKYFKEFPYSEQKINDFAWWQTIILFEKFETIFEEELKESTTYFVPRKGIFLTSSLVDAADQSFPQDIESYIPEKTKTEWKSAGRCLAFNLLSASGFHVARAVEGMMEIYFRRFCASSDDRMTWGDYIKCLEDAVKKSTTKPQEKTIAEFRQMKDDYRNPLMHPRVILTESDARILFNNGESLIIAMAQELSGRQQSVNTGMLTVVPSV